ncbi:MAG TPA: hypothetical protein VMU43_05605 [Candidatus Acidoferrum sp.]|nr:hypothetical protein [Candidatus Acidoferrum sp.]
MLGPVDYMLWLAGFLLEFYVVVSSLVRGEFKKYLTLNIYMLCAAFVTSGLFFVYHHFGFESRSYFYYYYYTDGLLYVLMYFVVIHFYQQVFAEMHVSRYIRGAAVILLLATAFFSYLVVHQTPEHLTSRFVVELEQNLNFVGVILTYLLWASLLKLHETRARLVQLVLALGVYFSATAGVYALHNLFPVLENYGLRWVPPLLGTWLPLAWAYTFTRVPEESRLLTAAFAMKAR